MTKPEVLTDPVDFGDNPYLVGAHEPIREELDRPKLECIGEVPKDFSGSYSTLPQYYCLKKTYPTVSFCVYSKWGNNEEAKVPN